MFQNTKCECGHQNSVGTVLCESCGKPLEQEADDTAPLEMRYDGVARRSQKQNPNMLDRVWNFFSSVKIAVILIIITLIGSAVGTIYPQENTFMNVDAEQFYSENYGTLGKIYHALGLSHTFDSWWFITLLVMIGTSLVICSLDRVLPLYRALSKQQIRKHEKFILRQKTKYVGEIEGDPEAWIEHFKEHLKRKHYRVHVDGTALLAEKNRFSRWGPYINHIGLIIFLLAVLARTIPGWHMDQYVGFLEGDMTPIPDTNYYLKNEKFTVEFYKDNELPKEFQGTGRIVPKLYETKAVLYECTANCDDPLQEPTLTEVTRHDITVNDPLEYKGLIAYQFDFAQTPRLRAVKASLKNKETGESYGTFDLKMKDPKPSFDVGPYHIEIKEKYMDFTLNDKGQPSTKSREPNAPAFIFLIKGPGLPEDGQPYMYFPRQVDKERFRQDDINGEIGKKLEISVGSMQNVEIAQFTTYLNIRVDRAMPYIWVGATISMIGLIMGFYWHHRRIWLRIDGKTLSLGAHTNKNWYGMRGDVAYALGKTGIVVDPKTLDNGGKQA